MLVVRFILILGVLHYVGARESRGKDRGLRNKKLLSLFQVVSFQNDPCISTPRNGTCYTSNECTQKGGQSGGSCASGFGVCCIIQLECGGTSSENNTYLVNQNNLPITTDSCSYKICPTNENICRIRYDFMAFTLAPPISVPAVDTVVVAQKNPQAVTNGNCVTDSFSISSPGIIGSPSICGTNTNYHMILDARQSCHTVLLSLGANANIARNWDILARQYGCGNEDVSGPPGCLQFHTGITGIIQNFNFPPGAQTLGANTVHLANQNYDICVRRERGFCIICYNVAINPMVSLVANQDSFGLSSTRFTAMAQAETDDACLTDFIGIPNGDTLQNAIAAVMNARAMSVNAQFTATTVNKLCGRFFSTAAMATMNGQVCSKTTPFRVSVNFDGTEATNFGNMVLPNGVLEHIAAPSGFVGFQLMYTQMMCGNVAPLG